MKWLNELWNDEAGSVVSAELVLLGTLGVVGVGVGAAAVGDSAEAELDEVAFSIRSLNQSYGANGFQGCGAWTAGSFFVQRPVEESHAALRKQIQRDRAALEREVQEAEQARDHEPRGRDREELMEDERRLERRRRMRERDRDQRREGGEQRWDGEDRPERRDDSRGPDAREDDGAF